MIKKWKFVSRRVLLEHPRMVIVEDTVELPNEKQTTYIRETPAGTHGVAIIAVNDKDEILIQQEYSYPPDEVMYQLPGGAMEAGEDIIEAANRELSEESGYIGEDCKILGYCYVNNRRSNKKQYVVLCKDLKKQKLQEDDDEFIESQWVSLDELNSMIKSGEIVNMYMLAAISIMNAKGLN